MKIHWSTVQNFQNLLTASLDQICHFWWNSLFFFPKNSEKNHEASRCNKRPLHQRSAQGKIFWSWDLVRWPLDASRGCLNFLRFLGEENKWISPNFANMAQTCSKHILKNLNWRPVDLHGSWLRVLRTSQGNLFGGKTQRRTSGSFVNLQGSK